MFWAPSLQETDDICVESRLNKQIFLTDELFVKYLDYFHLTVNSCQILLTTTIPYLSTEPMRESLTCFIPSAHPVVAGLTSTGDSYNFSKKRKIQQRQITGNRPIMGAMQMSLNVFGLLLKTVTPKKDCVYNKPPTLTISHKSQILFVKNCIVTKISTMNMINGIKKTMCLMLWKKLHAASLKHKKGTDIPDTIQWRTKSPSIWILLIVVHLELLLCN